MTPRAITACRFRNGELFVDTAKRKEIKVEFSNGGEKFIRWIECGCAAIDDDGHVSII
jgi:hypothetical protein